MTDLLATLRELCDAFGPPGFEQEVRRLIRSRVEPLADEIAETVLGNLIATRHGCDSTKTLLLDAHVDEVGLIVTRVEDDGFLRFASLGGIDPRVLPAQRVVPAQRVAGPARACCDGSPTSKWTKDRGKEPDRPKAEYPWFWGWDEKTEDFTGGKTFDGNWWNDCHYTNKAKQAAREAAGKGK
jgi:putative aminopeptidase FrvX